MPNNQKGIAHILILIILVAGLLGGLYLAQHPTIFKPKATDGYVAPPPIPGYTTTPPAGSGYGYDPGIWYDSAGTPYNAPGRPGTLTYIPDSALEANGWVKQADGTWLATNGQVYQDTSYVGSQMEAQANAPTPVPAAARLGIPGHTDPLTGRYIVDPADIPPSPVTGYDDPNFGGSTAVWDAEGNMYTIMMTKQQFYDEMVWQATAGPTSGQASAQAWVNASSSWDTDPAGPQTTGAWAPYDNTAGTGQISYSQWIAAGYTFDSQGNLIAPDGTNMGLVAASPGGSTGSTNQTPPPAASSNVTTSTSSRATTSQTVSSTPRPSPTPTPTKKPSFWQRLQYQLRIR